MQSIVVNGQTRTPSKILCIGRNYAAHAAELGNDIPEEMVVFGKPNASIGEELQSAFEGETLHFETEICFVVREGKFAAVGVGLDLTRRETQNQLKAKGLPWERCKAFRGAALFSEFIDFSEDFSSLRLELDIDGQSAQRGEVSQMLFPPADIRSGLEAFTTLEDDDVIMTGTPEGVGAVEPGAVFEARVFAGEQLLASQRWVAKHPTD
ncbi:MAG: fumarylacetoacetate hydrolase family protein [Granulosicoccaceae bacterium]